MLFFKSKLKLWVRKNLQVAEDKVLGFGTLFTVKVCVAACDRAVILCKFLQSFNSHATWALSFDVGRQQHYVKQPTAAMMKGKGWAAGDYFGGRWINLSAPCSFYLLHATAISSLHSPPGQAPVLLWPLREWLSLLLVFARLFRHNGYASTPVPIPLKCSWEYSITRTACPESQLVLLCKTRSGHFHVTAICHAYTYWYT